MKRCTVSLNQHDLIKKTVKLFDPVTRTKVEMGSAELQTAPDIKSDTLALIRATDIARLIGYNLDLLLQHRVTWTSFYLSKEENFRHIRASKGVKTHSITNSRRCTN